MPDFVERDVIDNAQFGEMIASAPDSEMFKTAQDVQRDYTRLKLREDGVLRKEMPVKTVVDAELDRQYNTASPVCVVDLEVNTPMAISAPFAQTPDMHFFSGDRYLVTFARVFSPWFNAEVDLLRTYVMDLKQVINDNAIKDMLYVEDAGMMTAATAMMGGAPNEINPVTGVVQWQQVPGGLSKVAFNWAAAVMPTMDGHLRPTRCIMNNFTVFGFGDWTMNEWGPNLTEDVAINGMTERELNGIKIHVTIKRDLFPDGSLTFFAGSEFMGSFRQLYAPIMYLERKHIFLSWFNYECIGLTFANPYAFTRTDLSMNL